MSILESFWSLANKTLDELHLSTVTGVVAMRPQFHHIDAKGQLAKAKQARERTAADAGRISESRLITQRAHTADDEELNIEKTENFLQDASDERWSRLQYHDEDVRRQPLPMYNMR